MDTGVGATGADHAGVRPEQSASRVEEPALNRLGIGLNLPAGVRRPVVGEKEPEGAGGGNADVYRRRRSTRFSQSTTTNRKRATLTI